MATSDGNGWVDCTCGARHWGRHGAAGLLLVRRALGVDERGVDARGVDARGVEALLQLRAGWTHEGGTWGLVGGARDSHENDVAAALREAGEEAAVDASAVRVLTCVTGIDHGVWRYTYVVALVDEHPGQKLTVQVRTAESDELRWVAVDDVAALPLHSGLRAAWPALSHQVAALVPAAG